MARQRLGQNFLASQGWREKIMRAVLPPQADSAAGGVWIEIGAGHGEMTALLAPQASRVAAVELDERLLPGLRGLAARLGNVSVASGDVLTHDFAELAGRGNFRVYGNIPYYITSPIVHHLLERGKGLEAAFLVMQLEVAQRLAARPGSRDYGYLSAFTQFHSRAEILLRIPPGAFRPAPKVSSALVELHPPGESAKIKVSDEPAFHEFLKACFAQKRKTLLNNLRALVPEGRAGSLLEECGVRRDARAEQLSLTAMARLFAAVRENYSPRTSAARRSG